MLVETVLALIRHGLTAGGTFLTAEGLATSSEVNAVGGAIVTVVGFGWSMWRKWKRANA